jgi:hypothetical protein
MHILFNITRRHLLQTTAVAGGASIIGGLPMNADALTQARTQFKVRMAAAR